MGGQMIDEGLASHITIVLVRDAESATREGGMSPSHDVCHPS
jgi:hypothetical protein